MKLRHASRFSDGQPFDADEWSFPSRSISTRNCNSPQRDLWWWAETHRGPENNQYTVRFTLAQPYAAAERILDSLAVGSMPRHLLQTSYQRRKVRAILDSQHPPLKLPAWARFG